MLLPIHIAAGGLAIVLGAVALIAKKGGLVHRRSGLLFIYAMLVMGITASILGFLNHGRTDANWLGGLMIAYFVGTALTAVRPAPRWVNVIALGVAAGLALIDTVAGVMVRFPMYFFLAVILMIAAIGDVRVMRAPRGSARLARHLWRMCFALFIAAGSFFSIRERVAKILPAPFTTVPMRVLPIVLLFGAMFYWLWRVQHARFKARPVAG